MVRGNFYAGNEANPLDHRVTLTLSDDFRTNETGGPWVRTTRLLCSGRTPGAARQSSQANLDSFGENRPSRGPRSIALEETVSWSVGDEIVIVSTDFDPNQAERRVISAINGNQVQFAEPLKFMHWGDPMTVEGHSFDQRAEVMNLTRNIKIQATPDSENDLVGAHLMITNEHHDKQMKLAKQGTTWNELWNDPKFTNDPKRRSHLSGVEFYRAGQAGQLGRYPFHWHMVGNFAGSWIKDSSVHRSFNRCYTVHGGFGLELRKQRRLRRHGTLLLLGKHGRT